MTLSWCCITGNKSTYSKCLVQSLYYCVRSHGEGVRGKGFLLHMWLIAITAHSLLHLAVLPGLGHFDLRSIPCLSTLFWDDLEAVHNLDWLTDEIGTAASENSQIGQTGKHWIVTKESQTEFLLLFHFLIYIYYCHIKKGVTQWHL